jgi:hypothetical protein
MHEHIGINFQPNPARSKPVFRNLCGWRRLFLSCFLNLNSNLCVLAVAGIQMRLATVESCSNRLEATSHEA